MGSGRTKAQRTKSTNAALTSFDAVFMVVPPVGKSRFVADPGEISMGHRHGDDRSVRHAILVCPDTSARTLRCVALVGGVAV